MMTTMTGDASRAGSGIPRLAVGLAWLGSTIAVGFVGWVYAALSDRRDDAGPGLVLLGLAVLGLVVTVAIIANRRPALILGLIASVAFVVGGMVAAALVSAGNGFDNDIRLVAVVPLIAAVVTWVLGRRALRLSR
jgi:hypothetical protein